MEKETTKRHSVKGIEKFKENLITSNVTSWPIIANHLIFIRFANRTVFTDDF